MYLGNRIYKPKQSFSKCNILIIRIDANDKLIESKPCMMCVHELKKHNINKVYYSTKDGNIECVKLSEFQGDHISHGVLLSANIMTKLEQHQLLGFTIT